MVTIWGTNVIVVKKVSSSFEYLDEIYPYIVDFINKTKETNYVRKIMFNCINLIFNNYIFKFPSDADEEKFFKKRNSFVIFYKVLIKQLKKISVMVFCLNLQKN